MINYYNDETIDLYEKNSLFLIEYKDSSNSNTFEQIIFSSNSILVITLLIQNYIYLMNYRIYLFIAFYY